MKTAVSYAFALAMFVLSACEAPEVDDLATTSLAAGNSDAVICCKELFPPGAERGQCISQAAHGLGPCAPVAPPAPDAAVIPPDAAAPDAVPPPVEPDAALPDAGVAVP
jgi:hypothetical protein